MSRVVERVKQELPFIFVVSVFTFELASLSSSLMQ